MMNIYKLLDMVEWAAKAARTSDAQNGYAMTNRDQTKVLMVVSDWEAKRDFFVEIEVAGALMWGARDAVSAARNKLQQNLAAGFGHEWGYGHE